MPLVLCTGPSWRRTCLWRPSTRSHPAGRMSLWPTRCAWKSSGWALRCQADSDFSCGRGSAALTSWQSREDVPSCWQEQGLACSVPRLRQPAALSPWVYSGRTAWLKLNLNLLPWRGTAPAAPSPSLCPHHCSWPWGPTFSAAVLFVKQTVNRSKNLPGNKRHFPIRSNLCFELKFSGENSGLAFTCNKSLE